MLPNGEYNYYGRALELASLSFFDKNKNYISCVFPETIDVYRFTTPENCYYIRYCTLGDIKDCYIEYTGESAYSSYGQNILNSIAERLEFNDKTKIFNNYITEVSKSEVDVVSGYYTNPGGSVITYGGACYTNPFYVKKGEILILFAQGANSGEQKSISSICLTDSEGSYHTPVVMRGGLDLPVSQFIASQNCHVSFSWLGNNQAFTLYKTNSDILEYLVKSEIPNVADKHSYNAIKIIASTTYNKEGQVVITPADSQNKGIYLRKNGGVNYDWNYGSISDYCIVEGLPRIHYKGSVSAANPIDVAFCCFYDINKNFISSLYTIAPEYATGAEGEFTTHVYEMDIEVPQDAYYARFTTNYEPLRVTVGEYINYTWLIDKLNKRINTNNVITNDNLGESTFLALSKTLSNIISFSSGKLTSIDIEEIGINTGYYISIGNNLAPLSFANYSNPILVKKGDYIIFTGVGGSSGGTPLLATISETDEAGSYYKSIVVKGGISETNNFSQYYATKDGYIAVSWINQGVLPILYKTKSDIATQIFNEIFNSQINVDITTINNKFNNVDYISNIGFTTFLDKCICIGDSVTDGHVYDYPRTPANGRVIREQSYPTYLKKMTQWSVIENAARAGISPVGWWQSFYPNYIYTDYQIALMELGYNGGLADTLDTDVNPYDNYENYAETNTGCYCKIIEAIKQANPNLYLILLIPSLWTPTTTGAITIRKIAEKYNLPIIDLSNSTYMNLSDLKYHGLTNSDPNSINMVHFNAIGHCAKAKFIYDALNKLFQTDAKRLNDIQPGV